MGQANLRKKALQLALHHLQQFGATQDLLDPDQSPSAVWLREHFVKDLLSSVAAGEAGWHNDVYTQAQSHENADVRRGIRAVMNAVLTSGLERGRVVFALLADAQLGFPEVIGEFDTCEPLAVWACEQLKVARHNLRIRYSTSFVPARAGLFGLLPTLELVTETKPLGQLPDVATRKVARESQKRQRLTFLVSVFTDEGIELDNLTPRGAPPSFQLPYWGAGEVVADRMATVSPLQATLAFDALEMLGFWDHLNEAREALASTREQAQTVAKGLRPVLQVALRHSSDPRFKAGSDVVARWRDVEMDPVSVYVGTFANFFIPQLERLGATLERMSGILPALPVVEAAPLPSEPSLFGPGGEWEHLS